MRGNSPGRSNAKSAKNLTSPSTNQGPAKGPGPNNNTKIVSSFKKNSGSKADSNLKVNLTLASLSPFPKHICFQKKKICNSSRGGFSNQTFPDWALNRALALTRMMNSNGC